MASVRGLGSDKLAHGGPAAAGSGAAAAGWLPGETETQRVSSLDGCSAAPGASWAPFFVGNNVGNGLFKT